jgi:colanic acid/amylovoran biosynthesis glycosyltransferase
MLVGMEAMALQTPVISTFVAGIPGTGSARGARWLIPAGNVEALASAMQSCLDAPPETIARMGDAARNRVLEHHDVDKEAAKLADLFRRLQVSAT